jgi:hypothetical protein
MLAVAAVYIKYAGGDLRQQARPCRLETSAGLVERRRRAGSTLSGFEAGIKAKAPAPLIGFDRYPGALTDRADTNVIVVDGPAFAVRIVVAAAG